MAQHDDQRDVEDADGVFDRAQHRRVDDVARGADHEHVAQARVEDDLGGDPAVGAADVLRAWGKLGYPRRAKRLHECATAIAEQFDDVVPSDVDTLLTLPGIGAYTARAIACFAYGQRVPVVDTNVRRVVARVVHGSADAAASSSPRDLEEVAALLPNDAEAPRFWV